MIDYFIKMLPAWLFFYLLSDSVYKWADENLMGFNKLKFEKMSHGKLGDIEGVYKKSGNEIKSKKAIKDL